MVSAAPTFDDTQRRAIVSAGLSAVSWPAVFAGAIAAAALSLILLVLGTGLGLAVVSPWAQRGASAEAISWSTIVWILLAAAASSALGGYIAGRLRVRWPAVHLDEVYFRDTAHGFLAWAVATLLTAATLTAAVGTILGGATKAGAEMAASGVQAAGQGLAAGAARAPDQQGSQSLYLVDALFRGAPTETPGAAASTDASAAVNRDEVARILDTGMRDGALTVQDTGYLGQLVARRTGLSQQEAEARVTATYDSARNRLQQAETQAKAAADQARKAGAKTALWIFVSLLLGAFIASLTATIGGRQRDMF